MGQMYLQHFEYRGGILKAEFDAAWGVANQAMADTGNWGNVQSGVKHHHAWGTGSGGYALIEAEDPKAFEQYQMFHNTQYGHICHITFRAADGSGRGSGTGSGGAEKEFVGLCGRRVPPKLSELGYGRDSACEPAPDWRTETSRIECNRFGPRKGGHSVMVKLALGLLLAVAAPASGVQPGTVAVSSQSWLDEPIKHLRIEGTLNGDTPFVVLLPDKEVWSGRLIHHLGSSLGGRLSGAVTAEFALEHGAAFVDSTQGHTGNPYHQSDDSMAEIMFEANHLVVHYAKSRCVELYRREPRYTYVVGNSGGAFRSTGMIERFPNVYDGAVTNVGGGTLKLHWFYGSLFDYYRRPLLPLVDQIEEAVGVNGEGDPFSVLQTDEQKEALRLILTAGWPRRMLGLLREPFRVARTAILATRYQYDPAYFEDFWKLDGYGGDEAQSAVREGIQGTVLRADASQSTLVIDAPDAPEDLFLHTLTFTSGKLAGDWRYIQSRKGNEIVILGGPGLEGAVPGDRFELDNRDLLAYLYYHRYIADPDEPAARDFYKDGRPLYPQRPAEAMLDLDETDRDVGNFKAKLITIFGSDDPLDWPTLADRYHRKVRSHLGDKIDDQYRIYFMERGGHFRRLSSAGIIARAYEDMLAWVERGVPPQPSTQYTLDAMNQLVLPATAAERKGYQPVVSLTANGALHRLEVASGQEVAFLVDAEDPDGKLAIVEMDFQGNGKFDDQKEVTGATARARFVHSYDEPGSYVAEAWVSDATETYRGSIQNYSSVLVLVR